MALLPVLLQALGLSDLMPDLGNGEVCYHVYAAITELQLRGIPHAHIIIASTVTHDSP
jgi:hypothetical protein